LSIAARARKAERGKKKDLRNAPPAAISHSCRSRRKRKRKEKRNPPRPISDDQRGKSTQGRGGEKERESYISSYASLLVRPRSWRERGKENEGKRRGGGRFGPINIFISKGKKGGER